MMRQCVKCENRCWYRVLRNKTKRRELKPEQPKAKPQNADNQSQAKQRRQNPSSQTENHRRKPPRTDAITSKAQAWVQPSIEPPTRR
jgi:hypothetical protein